MKKHLLSLLNVTEGQEFQVSAVDQGAPPPLLLRTLRLQVLDFASFDR
jgi:hypothetical protein